MKISIYNHPDTKPCKCCGKNVYMITDEDACMHCWMYNDTWKPFIQRILSTIEANRINQTKRIFGDTFERMHKSFKLNKKSSPSIILNDVAFICAESSVIKIDIVVDENDPHKEPMMEWSIVECLYPKMLLPCDDRLINRFWDRIEIGCHSDGGSECYIIDNLEMNDGYSRVIIHWSKDNCFFYETVREDEFREFCAQNNIELKWVCYSVSYSACIEIVNPLTEAAAMMFRLKYPVLPKQDTD